MKIAALIQARLGSTRLPGKVLKDIGGRTMLARVVRRAQRAAGIDEVVVVTTTEPADSAVAEESARLGVSCFRGSELDVLDRYYQAAKQFKADAVVRITSDCPLIDPGVVGSVVAIFRSETPDYASNVIERSYPRGLDTEIVSMEALERAWREAQQPYQREHVTPYFYENRSLFRLSSVKTVVDHSRHRWTVDAPEDLEFVRAVYARLKNRDNFEWTDVLQILNEQQALMAMNAGIRQKSVHETAH
jgi:spore coat polysaccharide biosynthesis protein SpsF